MLLQLGTHSRIIPRNYIAPLLSVTNQSIDLRICTVPFVRLRLGMFSALSQCFRLDGQEPFRRAVQ